MPSPESLVLAVAGPGEFDGIGDYASMLAQALEHATLVVSRRVGTTGPTGTTAGRIEVVSSWHELLRPEWIARGEGAAGVYVQYFPQAFVGSDLPALVSWLEARRRSGGRVTVTLHEYWPHKSLSPSRMVMRWRSRRALRDLVAVSTSMIVSQPYSAHELAASGLVPRRMLHVIPIGSAVPRVDVRVDPPDEPILAMFGQPAMMNAAGVAAIAQWLAGLPDGPRLWWFSRSEAELRDWWARRIGAPGSRVTFHGGLPAEALSRLLQQATLGLALYVDGASTRRSSLAALIEHRLPVVALDGRYTDARLRDSGALLFVHSRTPHRLPPAIAGLLADPRRRREMSDAAGRLYEETLAWPRIAAAYRALDAA